MKNEKGIVIRAAKLSDLGKLKEFFIKAYGRLTIFQDEIFLTHYFARNFKNELAFSDSLIGITQNGDIVSHYGGVKYDLKLKDKTVPITWGVNSYTLPAHRGNGVSSMTLDVITDRNIINGVIGFTSQTALFYQKLGYNVFDFKKYLRYVLVLDYDKTLEICRSINQNVRFSINQEKVVDISLSSPTSGEVVALTLENITGYHLNIDDDFSQITTTHRTIEFLMWRFLRNPHIKYSMYGFVRNGCLLAYIALRDETLEPFPYKVSRIIDLYGKLSVIKILVGTAVKFSALKSHIYIDFSMFGSIYDTTLKSLNFNRLDEEDYGSFPQVTSPIEHRPNEEFIALQSKTLCGEVENLSIENVYFTRMDSDRDRLANVGQISQV
jgi:hypothetical protein